MKQLDLLLSYFPRPLPTGMTQFETWSNRIISQAGQFADVDSMKWALASHVMHLDAVKAYVPDQYFIRALRKAAANQIASQVFQDIKNKQAARANTVEATTQPAEVANAETQTPTQA